MRIAVLILCLYVGPALAAGDRNPDITRLDFAATANFDSAIETHFSGSDTSTATQHSPRVSQKVRLALWTSQSILPPSAEVLRPKPPTAILLERSPIERIAAKTVDPPSHEGTKPYHLGMKPKRITQPLSAPIEEVEEPSLLQRMLNTLLPGE